MSEKYGVDIVLDESFLSQCMFCGEQFDVKGVYDFYCSEKCKEADDKRIQKAIDDGKHPVEILTKALEKEKEDDNMTKKGWVRFKTFRGWVRFKSKKDK